MHFSSYIRSHGKLRSLFLVAVVSLSPSVGTSSWAQTSPTQTSPTQTSPTQTTPTQTSPTQTTPSQNTPTQNQVPGTQQRPTQNQVPATQNQTPAQTQTPIPQNTANQPLSTLLQQASSAGSFTTLARAVEAAGLTDALDPNSSYTIFAPTDAAFAALPDGTVDRLLQPQNRELLRRVLAYHVIPQAVPSSELTTGAVRTLGGGVAVRVTPERILVNDGSVIQPDIRAQNGVVHAVSRVLLPQSLRQELQSLQ